MFEKLKNAIFGNKTTSVLSVPFLVGILIQIGYSFDADTTTVTDWNLVTTNAGAVLLALIAATGFKQESK